MKILIAVPTAGMLPVEFINSMDRLRSKHELSRIYIARSIVHVARGQAVFEMMKNGFDALMFLDDDMVFEPDLVDTLEAVKAPVASAPCFKRIPNYDPCFYEKLEINGTQLQATPYNYEGEKDPFDVVAAGTAAMLIRKEVFEKIQKPWFLPLPNSGEDLTFCFRLATAKIPIKIVPAARVGHLETHAIYAEHFLRKKNEILSDNSRA